MKHLKIFLVCALLFIAERCFFPRFEIFSLTPWLGFGFFLAAGAACEDAAYAAAAAGIYGIVCDLTGGVCVGSQTAIYAFFTLAQYCMCTGIFKKNAAVVCASSFISSFLAASAFFLLNFAAYPDVKLSGCITALILPLAALNTAAALVFYIPAKRLFDRKKAY